MNLDPMHRRWPESWSKGAMSKKQMGSSLDDFLREEGVFEEAQAQAIKEVVAWPLAQAVERLAGG